ncbi:PCI-domain-containing protein [Amylostereum chailletii]|nr:PCI-domain-containing protein [Amylostereum chailletii]
MSATDSVSIFAEGTFEEQILELAEYLARSRPEADRPTYIQAVQDSLHTAEDQRPLSEDEGRRRDVFLSVFGEVKTLGEGSEREIEGFFNLLYAHLLALWPVASPDTQNRVADLLAVVQAAPTDPAPKYRILTNLFNALPRSSPLRLTVYRSLLDLASANDELAVLRLSRLDAERWLQEWDISPADKSAFLQTLVAVHAKAGQSELAYEYKLAHVRSLDKATPEARAAALDAIATALDHPAIFDFDPLFTLDAVVAAKADPLFALLHVFLNGGLPELEAWHAAHAALLDTYGLAYPALEHKIRLLSLAALAFQNVGGALPYATLASTLRVDVSAVEAWVIDVIRAGLLVGKLSQSTETLHVMRATARTFERPQWALLEARLTAARASLGGVLEVVAGAKKKNTAVLAAVGAGPGEAAVVDKVVAQVEVAA